MRSLGFLVFVFLTFICWGVYGPTLHLGQDGMGAPGQKSSLRPFVCVGIAYFLIAVLYPLLVLYGKGETGKWTLFGFVWSFVAGAVGAVGALGIIMAFKFGGKPVYVMPLVFGCAPVVNTIVTMLMSRTVKQASMLFYLGVIIVAVGAAGVMYFKPAKAKPAEPESAMILNAQTDAENSTGNSDEQAEVKAEKTQKRKQHPGGSWPALRSPRSAGALTDPSSTADRPKWKGVVCGPFYVSGWRILRLRS